MHGAASGAKGSLSLVVLGFLVGSSALLLPACNLFQGFESFQRGAKDAPVSPTATPASSSMDSTDTGLRTRTGSVDVRAKLPEGALTPTPRPQETELK